MKKKIIYIFLSLYCFGQFVHSQTALDTCKQHFLLSRVQFKAERDSVAILKEVVTKLQYADSLSRKQIAQDSIALLKADSMLTIKSRQIEQFKNSEAKIVIPPLITFNGFYAGLSAQYSFQDSILTKVTFVAGINYAVELHTGITIGSKYLLDCAVGIPLSRQKLFIKVFIGYRVF